MDLPFVLRPSFIFSAAASVLLCQCASRPPEVATPIPTDDSYWLHEPASGEPRVVISLDEQRVALMKGDKLIGLSPISSGREGYDTHPGVFKVTEKDDDHRSSWYGAFVGPDNVIVVEDVDVRKDKAPPGTRFLGAEMRYFLRFNGPIGLHQGYLPGYPASHGCIRMPAHMAHLIYEATPHGTTVEVKQNASLMALRPPGAISELTRQAVQPAAPPPVSAPAPVPAIQATTPPVMLASTEAAAPAASAPPAPTAAPRPARKGFFGMGGGRQSAKTKPAEVAALGTTQFLNDATKPVKEAPSSPVASAAKPQPAPAVKPAPAAAPTPPKPAPVAAKPAAAVIAAAEAAAPAKAGRGWFSRRADAGKNQPASKPAQVASAVKTKPAPVAKPAPVLASTEPKLMPAPATRPAPGALAPPPARIPPPGKRGMSGGLRPISPNVPGAPPVRMTLAPAAGATLYAR